MATILSVFFQWFGVASFFGVIAISAMARKELKKQLPTAEEKEELIKQGKISADCKNKKILRAATAELRLVKQFEQKFNAYVEDQKQANND